MDELPVGQRFVIPGWELWMTTSTSGGPGGQHANRAQTRVTVHWVPANSSVLGDEQKRLLSHRLRSQLTAEGELQVSAADTRSQHQNLQTARGQLAETVDAALRPRTRRRPTQPSRSAKRRRLKAKRHRGQIKKLRDTPDFED